MNKEIDFLAEKLREAAVDFVGSSSFDDEIKPYPGLRPFEYRENYLFFGREGKAQEIALRLQQSRFVAVVGTSGSGKSSVVRAGLLPLLYGGMLYQSGSNWRIAIMRPEETPIRNLADALVYPVDFESEENAHQPKDEIQTGITEAVLRRSGVGLLDFVNNPANNFAADENLLIVVDQFEELFRFKGKFSVEYAEEAAAFVKLLLEATRDEKSRIFVVITMRSDFLGDCAEFQDLPEAINDGQYLIPQMTREQLRQSIESPAMVGGAQVSPALVNRILNDLDDDRNRALDVRERMVRDYLPVMQHALMRTWEFWKRRGEPDSLIDIEHYEEIGGIEHALSIHADEAYNELTDRQKMIAEKMFKCLTETDNENREIRRPAKIDEIRKVAGLNEGEVSEIYEVIEVFRREGRTFLMPPFYVPPTPETKIDISHESLIRNWERLKEWVKEEAEDALQYRRIIESATLFFDEYEQDPGTLWSGRALELSLEWRERFKPSLDWAARYQRLTEEENAELYRLRQISPEEEAVQREAITNKRFQQVIAFLDISAATAQAEQEERLQFMKLQAKERINKVLRRATVALVALVLLTTAVAILAYYQRMYAVRAHKELQEKNATLTEVTTRLEDQNKILESARIKLLEQNDDLEKARQDLEKRTKELEDIQKELRKNNTKLSKSVEETREEKQRADQQAKLARDAQAEAQSNFEKANATNEKLGKSMNLLNSTLQGTIAAEANDYKDAKDIFNSVLSLDSCGKSGDRECQKSKAFHDWWAHHNIATSSFQLRDFKSAEDNFGLALDKLGVYESLVEGYNNFSQPSRSVFLNVSYKPLNTKDLETINKSRIITLRKFAQFYRTCGKEPKKCFGDAHSTESEADADSEEEYYGDEKPLSPEAQKYYPIAIEKYNLLLDIPAVKNPATGKDKLYKAEVEKEAADIYIALKNYGSAKKYYRSSLSAYETDPTKSTEAMEIRKNLLFASVKQLPQEEDWEKSLKEIDQLAAKIISKTEDSVTKPGQNKVDLLYDKTVGKNYSEIGDIFEAFAVPKELLEKVDELEKRAQTDAKIKEILDILDDSPLEVNEYRQPADLTPEQQKIWDDLIKSVKIIKNLGNRARNYSAVGSAIQQLYSGYGETYRFGYFKQLANAYQANNECQKTLQLIPKLEAELDPKSDAPPDQKTESKTERVPQTLLLSNLKSYGDFYNDTFHDAEKAGSVYDEWVKAFKTKISENPELDEEAKFVEGKIHAGSFIDFGIFYYTRGKYDKAREMFDEYRKFTEKNAAYLGKVADGSDWNQPRISLKRLHLEILMARAFELTGNTDAALAEYNNLLSRLGDWVNNQKTAERNYAATLPSNTSNANRPAVNVNRSSTNSSNTAVNTTVVNRANTANANANRPATTTNYGSYYLSPLYKEAAIYEAYLRVRLADLYFNKGGDENIRIAGNLLGEKARIPFETYAAAPPFIVDGYISGTKNIAAKQTANEQAALYYGYAAEALENIGMNEYYYNDRSIYVRSRNLTKEFYTDYEKILTALDAVAPASPERTKKLVEIKKNLTSALSYKETEAPVKCADNQNRQ